MSPKDWAITVAVTAHTVLALAAAALLIVDAVRLA